MFVIFFLGGRGGWGEEVTVKSAFCPTWLFKWKIFFWRILYSVCNPLYIIYFHIWYVYCTFFIICIWILITHILLFYCFGPKIFLLVEVWYMCDPVFHCSGYNRQGVTKWVGHRRLGSLPTATGELGAH